MARRKHHRKRRSGRRHHRRSYRHNPGPSGLLNQAKAAMVPVGWGVVGFAGTTILPGLASRFIPLPDKASNQAGYYAVKVGAALATGFGVGMFAGRKAGQHALIGGGITIAAELVTQFAGPWLGLSDYMGGDEGVQAYLTEGGQVAYLNPGDSVSGMDENEESIDRLNPEKRF